MPGPMRIPTQILKARGSRLVNRNTREPQLPVENLEAPDWINKEAKRVWDYLSSVLFKMRLSTEADKLALERYCQLYARWKKAELFIKEHGDVYPVISSRTGQVVRYKLQPQVGMIDKLSTQLLKLEQSFGLTPSARSKIEASEISPKQNPEDDDEGKVRIFEGSA